ncbi:MAG: hypothetical protein ACQEXJ_16190 [Myxococcota bacterium]
MAERSARSPTGDAARSASMHVIWAAVAVLTSPVRFVRWLADWLHWWRQTPRRRVMAVLLVALLVLAALGTRITRLDLRHAEADIHRMEAAETSYLPPPLALKILSLGHGSFASDLVFVRANMYFVSHLFGDRIFEWLDPYVETMLALDPNNPRIYEWASQSVKFGQMISNEALEKSNSYARRGIEQFPDHWRFYFDIGFNYFHEWKPESPEEKERMRAKALPYFSIAATLPGSELDPNFVTSLYLRENDVEMALFHAYLRYWEAGEKERRALRRRITRYESEAAAQRLANLEERWKAHYPYVPFGLFELLGPPRDRALPESWARVAEERGTLPTSEVER